jgi:GcrA cell cycle regulator
MPHSRKKADTFAWAQKHMDFMLKLWRQGRGSQFITDALNDEFFGEPGTPVSRSAVSAKLCRTGNYRGAPNNTNSKYHTRRRPTARDETVVVVRHKPRSVKVSPLPRASEAARRAPVADPIADPKPPTLVVDAETDHLTLDEIRQLAPLARNGTVVVVDTLKTRDCKFPIGDPKREGFGFCARPRAGEGPYCCAHTRLVNDKAANEAVKRSSTLMDPRMFRFGRRRAG